MSLNVLANVHPPSNADAKFRSVPHLPKELAKLHGSCLDMLTHCSFYFPFSHRKRQSERFFLSSHGVSNSCAGQ